MYGFAGGVAGAGAASTLVPPPPAMAWKHAQDANQLPHGAYVGNSYGGAMYPFRPMMPPPGEPHLGSPYLPPHALVQQDLAVPLSMTTTSVPPKNANDERVKALEEQVAALLAREGNGGQQQTASRAEVGTSTNIGRSQVVGATTASALNSAATAFSSLARSAAATAGSAAGIKQQAITHGEDTKSVLDLTQLTTDEQFRVVSAMGKVRKDVSCSYSNYRVSMLR